MIKTVLSVDIGTTSLKAGLITASGEVVSFLRKEFVNSIKNKVSLCWNDAFNEAYDSFSSFTKDGMYEISAIAISGNGPTLVSDDGTTFFWYEDTVCGGGEASKFSLFIPRILTFQKKFPTQYEKSKYIFSGPEFLIYKLTGNAVTILPEKRFELAYWNKEMLEECNIPSSKLPGFVNTCEKCGEWNNIPVFAGGPDFIAALIGTNTLQVGKLCDRSGSSEGFNFCVDKILYEEGIRTLPSVIPGLWNISVLIPDSAFLNEEDRIKKIEQAVHKLRKLAEENNIPFPNEMAVTGGQAKNSLWMNVKKQATGMKLNVNVCFDAELLGDACCGFVGLGLFNNLQNAAEKICKNIR